ncbi:unnamed protein product [Schistosoma intercalatum]|nr:unnamed protein product [Schistosoma intercalatum]CAH8430250.1 unnamed protein product [Schistosoma intercalatum]
MDEVSVSSIMQNTYFIEVGIFDIQGPGIITSSNFENVFKYQIIICAITRFCFLLYRYIDLVNHYNALSHDSPVFANLVFWRCQQLCHVKYRRALWGEHQQVLNSLHIVLNQASC